MLDAIELFDTDLGHVPRSVLMGDIEQLREIGLTLKDTAVQLNIAPPPRPGRLSSLQLKNATQLGRMLLLMHFQIFS